MATYTLHATEDIPAHRFITTTLADDNVDRIGVELTPDGYTADYVTPMALSKGETITLDIPPREVVRKVEANEKIRAGRPVTNGPSGKLVERDNSEGLISAGLAFESGDAGDIVEIQHWPRLNGPLAESITQGGGGSAWNSEKTMGAVNTGLAAGANLSKSYNDQNGTLELSATDTQFSGKWTDITGKPSNYPPEKHGDSAHSKNYAEQSALAALEQRVADLESKVGGGGSGGNK